MAHCVPVPRSGVSECASQLGRRRPHPDSAPTAQLTRGAVTSRAVTRSPPCANSFVIWVFFFFACSCPFEHPSPPQSQRLWLTTYLSSGKETDPTSAGHLSGPLLSPSGCCTQLLPSAPRQLFLSRTSACPLAQGEGTRSPHVGAFGILPHKATLNLSGKSNYAR